MFTRKFCLHFGQNIQIFLKQSVTGTDIYWLREQGCVAWKQIRNIILLGLLARPPVLLNPINGYMLPGNLNGHDPSYERNLVV